MGYWPRKMKVRRSNWVTNLGRKLVLLGCEGHHEMILGERTLDKVYVLNAPDYAGEGLWASLDQSPYKHVQVAGYSESSATIRGAKMMGIL